ncbi:hypothetical protein RCL_jg5623.t1 [Rhizophagus clarus]|uniref:Uncharacterized protein n=1 Tax=Rhizophagus clarus TaxID=94130 RepID=A0A8H3R0F0_9GLOM|nr:hypothetical protein RCL_jg5623.t1 [Rhizophagus clarus]
MKSKPKSKNSDDKDNEEELQPRKDANVNKCLLAKSKMEYQMNASKQPTQYQYNFQIAKGCDNKNDHSCPIQSIRY